MKHSGDVWWWELHSNVNVLRAPGRGHGTPLQYSCLENPKERGAWRAIAHGVARARHDLVTEPPPGPLSPSELHSCSVTQSCLTLRKPMDCSTPGFLVLHHLTESAQTQVHWVCDAIQPSRPLSSPSPPAFTLPQLNMVKIVCLVLSDFYNNKKSIRKHFQPHSPLSVTY